MHIMSYVACIDLTRYVALQAFFLSQQYRRALWLLRNTDMIKVDLRFRYIAARCLAEVGDWEECLGTLGGWEEDTAAAVADLMQVRLLSNIVNCYYGRSAVRVMQFVS